MRTNSGVKKFTPPLANKSTDQSETCQLAEKQSTPPKSEKHAGIDQHLIEIILSEIIESETKTTFDDIAGLDFAKKTINEIVVWPMLRPDIFTGLRGPPKGLLLFGPPGTGKTLIGRCIATSSKATFFSISASSLTSKWIGESEKLVRALFTIAREKESSVIFVDEIDSLLSQRGEGEHESSRRIKTEFLVQFDGVFNGTNDRLLIIGATNRPQELDEAARRRFTKRLFIPLPEADARRSLLVGTLADQKHCLTDADILSVVNMTDGFSGADMKVLCKEAAMGAIRELEGDLNKLEFGDLRPILAKDFTQALKFVKPSVSESDIKDCEAWNRKFGSYQFE